MNRVDHLLWTLAEECAEVAQRASKAARFGLEEVQPGQEFTNAERLMHEYADLVGILSLLVEEGVLKFPKDYGQRVLDKAGRFNKFLERSKEHGRLD